MPLMNPLFARGHKQNEELSTRIADFVFALILLIFSLIPLVWVSLLWRDRRRLMKKHKIVVQQLRYVIFRPVQRPPEAGIVARAHRLRSQLSIIFGEDGATTATERKDGKNEKSNEQLQSALFSKLPTELRGIIWREYYRDLTIHIYIPTTDKGFVDRSGQVMKLKSGECLLPLLGPARIDFRRVAQHKAWLLSLPRTCRRLYVETINIVYARPTFHFDQPVAIWRLSRFVLPQRLAQITSIMLEWTMVPVPFYKTKYPCRMPAQLGRDARDQIYTDGVWRRIWERLSSMSNLRSLVISIDGDDVASLDEARYPWDENPLLDWSRMLTRSVNKQRAQCLLDHIRKVNWLSKESFVIFVPRTIFDDWKKWEDSLPCNIASQGERHARTSTLEQDVPGKRFFRFEYQIDP